MKEPPKRQPWMTVDEFIARPEFRKGWELIDGYPVNKWNGQWLGDYIFGKISESEYVRLSEADQQNPNQLCPHCGQIMKA